MRAENVVCYAARLDPERRVPFVARHAEKCLHCQAEIARDRRLRRALRALRDVVEPAPPSLAGSVASRLDRPGEVPSPVAPARTAPSITTMVGRSRGAAGAVLATLAGAAAVVLWRRKHSPA